MKQSLEFFFSATTENIKISNCYCQNCVQIVHFLYTYLNTVQHCSSILWLYYDAHETYNYKLALARLTSPQLLHKIFLNLHSFIDQHGVLGEKVSIASGERKLCTQRCFVKLVPIQTWDRHKSTFLVAQPSMSSP